MSGPRYAIYYAPAPGTPLWSFGSSVLGYDAATGVRREPLAPEGVPPDEWEQMTAQPRRYGFHATLKAPFRLAEGAREDDLVEAGREFAKTRRPFALPTLEVSAFDGFVALAPIEVSPELDLLAAACVTAFEPFRAPLSEMELARRLEGGLNHRQEAALRTWGYPHVFEDFHFHMTLTGALPPDLALKVRRGLSALYENHVGAAPTRVDAVTLYVEESRVDGFRIVDRFVFGG